MQGRRWKSSWPISEHRLADAAREKVVEEEMDLREHARRTSGAVVHGYGRLDAGLVHSRGARARGHRDPGGPGDRERPQVLHAVGEIAEAFAVENGRRHGVE